MLFLGGVTTLTTLALKINSKWSGVIKLSERRWPPRCRLPARRTEPRRPSQTDSVRPRSQARREHPSLTSQPAFTQSPVQRCAPHPPARNSCVAAGVAAVVAVEWCEVARFGGPSGGFTPEHAMSMSCVSVADILVHGRSTTRILAHGRSTIRHHSPRGCASRGARRRNWGDGMRYEPVHGRADDSFRC